MTPEIQKLLQQLSASLEGFKGQLGGLSQQQKSQLGQSLSGLSSSLGKFSGGQTGASPTTTPTITSQSLAPSQEIDLSGFNFTSSAPGLIGQFQGFLESQRERATAEAEKERQAVKQRETDIEASMKRILEIEGSRAGLEEEAGIPKLSQELTDIQNQMDQRSRALTHELRAIEKNTAGMSASAVQSEKQRAQRDASLELADMSIILNARNRNLSTTTSIIDRKIKLQLEPLEEQIQFQKFFLDRADTALTSAEKKELEATTRAEENIFEFLKTEMKAIHTIAAKAAENGADQNLYNTILGAKSQAEAIQLAGDFVKEAAAMGIVPGGGVETSQKPLSINQIEQFRRSFGWTPPLGFSMTQLEQFVADNPGATPEELEAGAKQIAGQLGLSQETEIEELETGGTDLDRINRGISSAKDEGFSKEEIKQFILNNFDEDTLFQLAKQQGFAKWYTGKKKDIDRMLNALI